MVRAFEPKKMLHWASPSFQKIEPNWAKLSKKHGSRAKIQAEPRLDPALQNILYVVFYIGVRSRRSGIAILNIVKNGFEEWLMMLRKMQKEIRKKLRWIDFSRLNFLFLQDCEKEYQPRQILHYILQTFLLSHIFLSSYMLYSAHYNFTTILV